MEPKCSRSTGGGVGSGAGSSGSGSSGSVLRSLSTCGRDGRGEGAVMSRSAMQAFEDGFLASGNRQKVVGGQSSKRVEQEARRGPGGSSESCRWAGGSGQSDVDSAHDDV